MDNIKTFDLDGVQYQMTPANASSAWFAMKNALKLVQSINLSQIGKIDKEGSDQKKIGLGLNILGGILQNLGDPSVKALEDLVLKHTSVSHNGSTYRLSDKFDSHFNQFRKHLIPVLKEGLIYQFADFLPAGIGLPATTPTSTNPS